MNASTVAHRHAAQGTTPCCDSLSIAGCAGAIFHRRFGSDEKGRLCYWLADCT